MLTVVKAASLIDGTGRRCLRDPVITIEDGRIRTVSSGKDASPPKADRVDVLDFSGKTILPGLIDGHAHLLFDPEVKGRDEARRKVVEESEARLALRALQNAQTALTAGVTTLVDCGGRGFVTLEVRDAIATGLVLGPRLHVCGPPITTTNGHLHYVGYHADSSEEMRKAVRVLIREGVDLIKIMATGGNMTQGTNPSTAQYTVEELKAAVHEAHRVGRRVVAHAHGAPGVRNAIQAGVDIIAHCKWQVELWGREYEPRLRQELGQGASYWKPPGRDLDPVLVEKMVEQGTVVDLTFSSVRRALIPKQQMAAQERAASVARLRELHEHYRVMKEAGVQITVSSDAGAGGTTFGHFALGPLGVVEAGVMTPTEAIVAVTGLVAKAIGLEDEVGTVEPGKSADLIVVDGNPLKDLRALGRIECVILRGRPVVRNGAMVA